MPERFGRFGRGEVQRSSSLSSSSSDNDNQWYILYRLISCSKSYEEFLPVEVVEEEGITEIDLSLSPDVEFPLSLSPNTSVYIGIFPPRSFIESIGQRWTNHAFVLDQDELCGKEVWKREGENNPLSYSASSQPTEVIHQRSHSQYRYILDCRGSIPLVTRIMIAMVQ